MTTHKFLNVNRAMAMMLSIGILCLCSATAQAEGSFGFFGGLNMSKLGGDIELLNDLLADGLEYELGGDWTVENTNKMGMGFGAYYHLKMSPTFGISFEGQYIERGTKMDLTGKGVPNVPLTIEGELNFNFTYFEIPVLARFTGSPDASFHPILLGGPVLSIETGSEIEVVVEGADASLDIGPATKSTTLGFIAGAGFAYDVGPTSSLVVQGRYYAGLSSAFDVPIFSSSNSGFGFFAGMEFALGN